ncbi:MAG TPA: hypothetical protein VF702_02570 [Allosphingosinicella sp.]|jgi:hypothetical protein
MSRVILAVSALLLTSFPAIEAPAQAAAQANQPDAQGRCQNQQSRRRRGNLIGGIGSRVLGRAGVPSSVVGVGLPTEQILSEAITSLLDCREREQAATATNEAIRGGVGTTSNWQSETRPGVSGSASSTGEQRTADGTHCVTVTNVVIVDGEEAEATERLCRGPRDRGYARV